MLRICRTMKGVSAALALSVVALCATAQEKFPSRPIEMVIPTAAGGGTDISLRMLAELAEPILGQKVVVVNKTGGGGTVGMAGDRRGQARRLHHRRPVERAVDDDAAHAARTVQAERLRGRFARHVGADDPVRQGGVSRQRRQGLHRGAAGRIPDKFTYGNDGARRHAAPRVGARVLRSWA